MTKKATTILDLIGDTPIIKLNKLREESDAAIWGKLEYFNPLGSVKDRIGLAMIEAAEREGKLRAGGTIIEPTSGNTGIGLAMVAAVKGYRLILTMPDTMSMERRNLLSALGAKLLLTPGKDGMQGAIIEAERVVSENPTYFMPQQFKNPANPEVHRRTTGPEILKQVPGKIDALVASVGTGGTITGVGEALRKTFPRLLIVAVEPKNSAVLSGGKPGPHKIQGIGAGFIPGVLRRELIDEVIPVGNEDAASTARQAALKEGLLLGISSGAAIWAALRVARRLGEGKTVVVILPDSGERYLSTELFKR